MTIDFYINFTKKKNSTKRPVEGGIVSKTTLTGYLKEPCSIFNPVINIQNIPIQNSPEVMNYAYINIWQRYYFVEDWVWNDGLWTVRMTCDVLATWRHEIGEQQEYILRTDSATTDFDGAITDTMYPATTDFNLEVVNFNNPFETVISDGCYVVGIINGASSNSIGAITYYAMTAQQFGSLKQTLFGNDGLRAMNLLDNTDTWTATDMTEEIFKTMYNPYQYIASCTWFPISQSSMAGSSVSSIKIGWWTYNLSGKLLSSVTLQLNESPVQLPVHPQAATRGKYLNYAPYTKMTLHGKFGSLPIDTSYLEIGNYMINIYTIDLVSGQCLFQVYIANNSAGTGRKLIVKTEFLIGTPIQLAQIGRDYLGATVNAISAGSSAMQGAMTGGMAAGIPGAIIGAIANAGNGIYNTIQSSMPQLQTSGVNGSFMCSVITTQLIIINYIIVDEDITHRGRPLCKVKTIKNLTGYVLCAEGDIDIACFDNERDIITKFLTTGFFWE